LEQQQQGHEQTLRPYRRLEFSVLRLFAVLRLCVVQLQLQLLELQNCVNAKAQN
jgi:hypothetical protein